MGPCAHRKFNIFVCPQHKPSPAQTFGVPNRFCFFGSVWQRFLLQWILTLNGYGYFGSRFPDLLWHSFFDLLHFVTFSNMLFGWPSCSGCSFLSWEPFLGSCLGILAVIGLMGDLRRRSRRRTYIPDDALVHETRDPLPQRRSSTTNPLPRDLLPTRRSTTLPYDPLNRTELYHCFSSTRPCRKRVMRGHIIPQQRGWLPPTTSRIPRSHARYAHRSTRTLAPSLPFQKSDLYHSANAQTQNYGQMHGCHQNFGR